ncbi:hybrid sensor histidine kinase/response regulator, partial [Vibrio alginolyticus]|nr:hybrid sensor histidine kinase/response regulator [Vibrio alginolyticus]
TLGGAVQVDTRIAEDLWIASADPARLENVILNLAINARHAMDGQGRLTIEVGNVRLDAAYAAQHHDVQPGDYVLLSVAD